MPISSDTPVTPGKVKMGDVRALDPIYYSGGAPTPFFLDEATGSAAAYSGHTPDIGLACDTLFDVAGSGSSDPGLTTFVGISALSLDGSGHIRYNFAVNGDDAVCLLPGSSAPGSPANPDYACEMTLILPGAITDGNLILNSFITGRGTLVVPDGRLYGIGFYFELTESDSTHRSLDLYVNSYAQFTSPTFTSGTGTITTALGAASSVVFRVEFEGRQARCYVDGVLKQTAVWTGTTEFDPAGVIGFSNRFFSDGGVGGTYFPIMIDKLLGILL